MEYFLLFMLKLSDGKGFGLTYNFTDLHVEEDPYGNVIVNTAKKDPSLSQSIHSAKSCAKI